MAAMAGGMLPPTGGVGVPVCPGGVVSGMVGGVTPVADGSPLATAAFSPPEDVPAISVPEVPPELLRNDDTAKMITPTSATPPPASNPIINPLPLFFGGVRRCGVEV